jgi:hypothetical protein
MLAQVKSSRAVIGRSSTRGFRLWNPRPPAVSYPYRGVKSEGLHMTTKPLERRGGERGMSPVQRLETEDSAALAGGTGEGL